MSDKGLQFGCVLDSIESRTVEPTDCSVWDLVGMDVYYEVPGSPTPSGLSEAQALAIAWASHE
jgi:hypothetical protein